MRAVTIEGEQAQLSAAGCCGRASVSRVTLAVVEDQPLYRDLLTAALRSHPSVEVVVSAGSVAETRTLINARRGESEEYPIDVLIVDLELPDGNGVGLAVQLRREHPGLGVVVLSSKEMLDVVEALPEHQRRPWSYLHKASASNLERLLQVIWASLRGVAVIDSAFTPSPVEADPSKLRRLSARQLEVLALVADGLTNEAIATRLDLSLSSVVNHLGSVYQRLELPADANPRVAATLAYLSHLGVTAPDGPTRRGE